MQNRGIKSAAFWILMIVVALLLWQITQTGGMNAVSQKDLSFSDFMIEVERGTIAAVTLDGNVAEGYFKQAGSFKTIVPNDYPDMIRILREKGVKLTVKDRSESSWFAILISFAPLILIFFFFVFMMRQMSGAGKNGALTFGKSKAKLLSLSQKKITFKDVAGADEAKEELQEVVEFLREPGKFQKLGGRIPRGVLLVGPPGTGKTLLARAVAGEANAPFFSLSGSDFVEMFVGVGASRVRDLFEQGHKHAPCIIFIDELDAVGRHRGAGLGGGHDEREQTLNALLTEMDGFNTDSGVIIVAATNRPDVLDPALLRPGRFDRRVVVPRPDVGGRVGILQVHTKKTPLAEDVDLTVIARGTPGFSGADLENLVNEAALIGARSGHGSVAMADFEKAKDKVIMGAERRSMVLTDEEKRITAWHEAGHALVAMLNPHADPVHKVSIIPRGMALGITAQLPENDQHNYSKSKLLAMLEVMMGGRVAEELKFDGEITTGASNDIERATELAHGMVCEWGMSELGPVRIGPQKRDVFLGKYIADDSRSHSESMAQQVDELVRKFVSDAHKRAKAALSSHRNALNRIAEALLERETLDGADIKKLIAGEGLIPAVP
ncbi:MAG: ATP-dependent zinc metalloprotease FtsH [bacterium]|nr:ATP-dependent zinc metalloprotease FtsH [bacterium]